MKKEDLFEGFGGLDEDLLLRSEATGERTTRFHWVKRAAQIASIAACFAFMFWAYDTLTNGENGEEAQDITPLPVQTQDCLPEEIEMVAEVTTEEIEAIKEEELTAPLDLSDQMDRIQQETDSYSKDKQDLQEMVCKKYGDEVKGNEEFTKMISGYENSRKPMASDHAVNSGCVSYSDDLLAAMEEYGSEVHYRVVVELFSEGVIVGGDSKAVNDEMERVAALGYVVAQEVVNDGYITHFYNTLHATNEQLRDYPALEQYGYYFLLYDEAVKGGQ